MVKGWPFRPGRTWRKRTGEPSFFDMFHATTVIMGDRRIKAKADTKISINRLNMEYGYKKINEDG
ncbi:hypothetical protein GCM10011450_24180 [Advenella faeciporci]|uniref:Uncharacterized protein n=1 Tax=Advenella faeciporci TaxID=797535 RepID=A0A918JQP0_9BURK|nr:hypothetical protein GCM10011450_24180 [Advenella faeciporci]